MINLVRKPNAFESAVFLFLSIALSHPANAASVYFAQVGGPGLVQSGDALLFDVIIDFTDEPTIGGGFDIVWDPTALSFEQLHYNLVGDPSFGRPPDFFNNTLNSWGFGAFEGISGVHIMGTLEFSVLPTMGLTTELDFGCSGLQSCFFISSEDFVTIIPTELRPIEISRVPIPASGLLLASALVMFRVARRKN